MSRIIAGAGKGRRLKTAGGDATRPTGARVRQSLFDILAPMIPGCRFLDAFAGNGGVGLEALSRGAAKVVLVDKASAAVEAAKENARVLARAGGEVQVFRQDARTAIGAFGDQGMQFDVVYLDPPYDSDLYEPLLAVLGEGPLLAEGGVVVAEHFHKRALPETIGALARTREKRVGDHILSFYRRASGEDRTVGADEEARGADGRADGKSAARAHDGATGRAGGGPERGQSEEEAS
ncbi:MAG TPA: 16S rRNA (guanine(966)-N(2))-methyltransferase RsmD [Vicinamibacteria bacterium]|nr:16S rRNA (guanine(966)-N(2))-methyltransferase RsmD [Vicinamibacteria bacterium]